MINTRKIFSQRQNELNNIDEELKNLNVRNSKLTYDEQINMKDVRINFPSSNEYKKSDTNPHNNSHSHTNNNSSYPKNLKNAIHGK